MKKTLALVLALVMIMGMMVVPASAAFDDAADIQYTEAVDVMAAIGVIEGYNNEFNPQGELTRAAGAKLVAYLELGAKGAEALTAENAPFADVPADHWAAGYIGWAASKGYLAGVGNNNFAPDAPLTALAYAKLMLCALGYDAAIEGYTGNGWEYNVMADAIAKDVDLFDGNEDADMAAVATREEAALYSFNALNAKMVKYSSKGTQVEINGAVISTGASEASNTGMDLLREVRYEKLELVADDKTDAFGRPANNWKYDGEEVGAYSVAPVVTYNTKVKDNKMFNDIGAKGKSDSEIGKYIEIAAVTVDGAPVELKNAIKILKSDDDSTADYTANGTIVEIYESKDEDGKTVANTYDMVVINEYLAKVDGKPVKADADKGTKRYVNLDVYTGSGTSKLDKTFETEEFAKDDYVLVTIAAGEVKTAVKAESFTGKITAKSSSSVTVDGDKSNTAAKLVAFDAADYTSTFKFFKDTMGNVIGQDIYEAASSTEYFFIKQIQVDYEAGSLMKDEAVKAKAKVIFLDGTEKTIDLEVEVEDNEGTDEYYVEIPSVGKDGAAVTKTKITADITGDAGLVNYWFAYAVENDVYAVEVIDDTYAAVAGETELAKDKAVAIGGKYTTADTVITKIDTDNVVTSYVGYASEAETLTGAVLYTYAKNGNTVVNVYAVEQAAEEESVTYAYAVKSGDESKYGTSWTFAVDGKQVTYVVRAADVAAKDKDGNAILAKNNVYKLTEDKNDTVKVEKVAFSATGKKIVVAASGDQIVIETAGALTMTDDCAIYLVNEDDVTEFVGEAYTAVKDDVVSYILKGEKVDVIYVTALAD